MRCMFSAVLFQLLYPSSPSSAEPLLPCHGQCLVPGLKCFELANFSCVGFDMLEMKLSMTLWLGDVVWTGGGCVCVLVFSMRGLTTLGTRAGLTEKGSSAEAEVWGLL